jgi:hypothetical protein
VVGKRGQLGDAGPEPRILKVRFNDLAVLLALSLAPIPAYPEQYDLLVSCALGFGEPVHADITEVCCENPSRGCHEGHTDSLGIDAERPTTRQTLSGSRSDSASSPFTARHPVRRASGSTQPSSGIRDGAGASRQVGTEVARLLGATRDRRMLADFRVLIFPSLPVCREFSQISTDLDCALSGRSGNEDNNPIANGNRKRRAALGLSAIPC